MEQVLQAVLELSNKMDNQFHELDEKIDLNHGDLSEKIKKDEVKIGILATEFNSIKADIYLI